MKRLRVLIGLFAIAACGSSSSPTAPSTATPTTTPTTAPATTTFTLSGTISSAGGGGLVGATVTILDGSDVGKSATTGSGGTYAFSGLRLGGFTMSITAAGFATQNRGVTLTSNTTLSVALLPAQLFTQSGVGDNVFTIPAYVTRVRIDASYQGTCQNFIVKAGTSLLVNVIIGNCSVADTRSPFSGTYAITAGAQMSITSSTGIAWTFTEVRS